ncbi:unnamed protein product [Miscanthus lutarioriparius]|uniref:Rho GDP-dissociation inhibitor 1 n=1 Tax=Miscanthus lutarioriparius TaxID=422564 RepID=A0A811RRY6_9POAL|nr:unnamed protein product [Miscanthus lutarioriparius]
MGKKEPMHGRAPTERVAMTRDGGVGARMQTAYVMEIGGGWDSASEEGVVGAWLGGGRGVGVGVGRAAREASGPRSGGQRLARGRPVASGKETRTTGSMDKEENKEASVSISNNDTDTNGLDDDDYDDDDGKHTVMLGPQIPLKDHLELDKDDDSLRRWKEQLLGDVDTTKLGETAEPEVTILNLTILTPERPDLVLAIPLVLDDKGYAFALKDGSTYSFRFSFTVSNNIVSGLRYTHTVWKTGVRVEKQKVMLGTFSPRQEPYTYEAEEDTTPSGIFARGSYSAKLKFVDDDGNVYLDMNYCFEIKKDWPATA